MSFDPNQFRNVIDAISKAPDVYRDRHILTKPGFWVAMGIIFGGGWFVAQAIPEPWTWAGLLPLAIIGLAVGLAIDSD